MMEINGHDELDGGEIDYACDTKQQSPEII